MSWTISENLRTISSGGVSNIVKQATYRYTATNGKASAYYEKVAEFEYNAETFTPFASLTEDQVIGWVEAHLIYQGHKNHLEDFINNMKQPTNVGMIKPWE